MSADSNRQAKIDQAQSGTARAALLGISDGLVTNVSLILGVAGAGASEHIVRVAGLASLIAGACSMAVGEYISMRGQAELLAGVLAEEQRELRDEPERARRDLQDVMEQDGVDPATAKQASREVMRDPIKAMAMYARGKLGVNPDELGSPWSAAGSSLFMFALGAGIPLLVWFFTAGWTAIIASLALSAVAALAIGSYLGYMSNGRVLWAALRQLLLLIVAATATYLVGVVFHTTVL
jgi:VIT1/CCC1 family predicted Fe2+/Mn2+ transporter